MDLDTFLTTLYVLIDDWYKREMSALMERHAGPALQLSDSEVLTIAIAAQWTVGVPWQSERGIVRYMLKRGRSWFPRMLKRSQFNQRLRHLWAAFVCLQQELGQRLSSGAMYEVVDCAPVPHCSLGQAISHDRHWLSGKKGRGGNHGSWFYGEQLLLCASDSGLITGWMVGLANIDDRWMMEALLSSRKGDMRLIEPPLPKHRTYKHRPIPAPETFSPAITAGHDRGLPFLADGGFSGKRRVNHWRAEYGAEVIAPRASNIKGDKPRKTMRWLRKHRQIIETVIARLVETYGLQRINAHSELGMLARLAAKMAAYNIGVLLNRRCGRPDGAMATLIC